LKVVPLNRSHLRGAVELHRSTRPWCYRGKNARRVLRAFYDAYANRDYTAGTAALEGASVVGVACGTTDLAAPARWLARRRPWRSLCARVTGGADVALGGWDAAALARASADTPRPGYLLAAATADALSEDDVGAMFDAFAASLASRGVSRVFAPAPAPDERLARVGFKLLSGEPVPNGDGFFLYARAL
jgi:hypothetical protein